MLSIWTSLKFSYLLKRFLLTKQQMLDMTKLKASAGEKLKFA